MTLNSLWKARAEKKRRKVEKTELKIKRVDWTALCVCGHPQINHARAFLGGSLLPNPCPCGCIEFRKAMRKSRRSKR